MIPRLFDPLRTLVTEWREDAARRRKVVPTDQAADALAFCAAGLEQQLALVEASMHRLTAGEYAELHGVTRETVRNWFHAGLLSGAVHAGGELRIPATLKPPQIRRHRKPAA